MVYIDGLVQDCSISSALAMEILQACTKISIYSIEMVSCFIWDCLFYFIELFFNKHIYIGMSLLNKSQMKCC